MAIPVGPGVLDGWEFSIFERGYATIAPSIDRSVEGGLWWVTDSDVSALDHYEGVASGFYRREVVVIETPDGQRDCVVYIADREEDGAPNPGYLELVVDGARWFDLSASHIAELEGWGA